MSVIVKGMKMPKTCYDCIFYGGLECSLTGFDADRKSRHCPLVELPPHGRLIDADALTAQGYSLAIMRIDEIDTRVWRELVPFDYAPTIIEEEDEK